MYLKFIAIFTLRQTIQWLKWILESYSNNPRKTGFITCTLQFILTVVCRKLTWVYFAVYNLKNQRS